MGVACSCDGCHDVLRNANFQETEELHPVEAFWGAVDPPNNLSRLPFATRSASPSSSGCPTDLDIDPGKEEFISCCSIGAVVKTRDRASNSVRALKQICKKQMEGTAWREEVEVLKHLDHPHICKLHGSWEDRQSVYLIMELCRGGNIMELSDSQDRFNESSIALLVRQMVDAVSHLHQHGVVHSDIRPENWLFGEPIEAGSSPLEMRLKMIDFGIASKHGKVGRRSRQESTSLPLGHLPRNISRNISNKGGMSIRSSVSSFSEVSSRGASSSRSNQDLRALFCKAPEQVTGAPDPKADVWALGVISYFMLSGQSPFNTTGIAPPEDDLAFRHARFVFMPSDIWRPISSEAKNFIAMCLQRDPELRPPAEKMLKLPWMRLAEAALDPASGGISGESSDLSVEGSRRPSLSLHDPPLPTAQEVLCSFARIRQAQLVERAAIIAAARCVPSEGLSDLREALMMMDPEGAGVLPMCDVLAALASCGVPCADLASLTGNLPSPVGTSTVLYMDFLRDVQEFQQNMQDIVLWSVFRGFDVDGRGTVPKQDLVRALGLQECRESLLASFPKLSLEGVVEDLGSDATGVIDFEDFKQRLKSPGSPTARSP